MREFDGMTSAYTPLLCGILVGGVLMVVNLQLASHDPNLGRGLDPNADAMADDPIDRDHDSIADDEFFANFSTEH